MYVGRTCFTSVSGSRATCILVMQRKEAVDRGKMQKKSLIARVILQRIFLLINSSRCVDNIFAEEISLKKVRKWEKWKLVIGLLKIKRFRSIENVELV